MTISKNYTKKIMKSEHIRDREVEKKSKTIKEMEGTETHT